MADYEETIDIAAAPDAVFPFLIEPERLKRWVGGFVESRPIGSAHASVGTRSIDVFREGGREILMETEIKRMTPPSRLEVAIAAPGIHAVSDYRLEKAGTGTRIVHRQHVDYRGALKLVSPFVHSTARRRLREDLVRLKAAVEG